MSYNRSDFYDIFGPTKLSRKGYAAVLDYDHFLIFDEPRRLEVKSEVAYYYKLDALPSFQNVPTTVDRLATGEIGLYYTFVRKSLGAVDDEKGLLWNIVASVNDAEGTTYPQLRGQLDFGFAASRCRTRPSGSATPRAPRMAIAARPSRISSSAPSATTTWTAAPSSATASGTPSRASTSTRSTGKSFARTMVEVNVPPYVFESAGTPGFYLNYLRPAVFVSELVDRSQ